MKVMFILANKIRNCFVILSLYLFQLFFKFLFLFIPQESALNLVKFKAGCIWDILRQIVYTKHFGCFGDNSLIKEGIIIKYPQRVRIGNNTTINDYCYLHGIGELDIGNNVAIASYSRFVTFDHKFDKNDGLIVDQGYALGKIVIEDDVWIGLNVTVLKGVRIGKGSVIGANTLVLKDVPPNSIVINKVEMIVRKR